MLALMVAAVLSMAPATPYVHIGQPVKIRFMQSDDPAAPQQLAALGLQATKLSDFKPASPAELIDENGLPGFDVYAFDGTPLKPTAVKQMDLSSAQPDIAKFYPQIQQPGTYFLTWQSATPLVIETLTNPGRAEAGPVVIHIEPLQYALITTADGPMKAIFAYDVAPHTVDNFISLASQDFYNGSAFHRIIKGFMIQGGDPNALTPQAGTGGPGYQITQEFNDRPHVRGVLSMARSQSPDSAGSQFFIVHQAAPSLDHQYTVFGALLSGLDVLDKIADTPTSGDNGAVAPNQRPVIKSIQILPATPEMYGIKPKVAQ